jgi:hypothetical protein
VIQISHPICNPCRYIRAEAGAPPRRMAMLFDEDGHLIFVHTLRSRRTYRHSVSFPLHRRKAFAILSAALIEEPTWAAEILPVITIELGGPLDAMRWTAAMNLPSASLE